MSRVKYPKRDKIKEQVDIILDKSDIFENEIYSREPVTEFKSVNSSLRLKFSIAVAVVAMAAILAVNIKSISLFQKNTGDLQPLASQQETTKEIIEETTKQNVQDMSQMTTGSQDDYKDSYFEVNSHVSGVKDKLVEAIEDEAREAAQNEKMAALEEQVKLSEALVNINVKSENNDGKTGLYSGISQSCFKVADYISIGSRIECRNQASQINKSMIITNGNVAFNTDFNWNRNIPRLGLYESEFEEFTGYIEDKSMEKLERDLERAAGVYYKSDNIDMGSRLYKEDDLSLEEVAARYDVDVLKCTDIRTFPQVNCVNDYHVNLTSAGGVNILSVWLDIYALVTGNKPYGGKDKILYFSYGFMYDVDERKVITVKDIVTDSGLHLIAEAKRGFSDDLYNYEFKKYTDSSQVIEKENILDIMNDENCVIINNKLLLFDNSRPEMLQGIRSLARSFRLYIPSEYENLNYINYRYYDLMCNATRFPIIQYSYIHE